MMNQLRSRIARATTLAAATAVALLSTTPAPIAAQDAAVQAFDAYVAKAVRDWKLPGLAIAIVRNDSVILAKGYGLRTVGTDQRVDAGTRFAIGSTTKAMTAVALGMLVDEGKVRWDDPVVKHLPWFAIGDPWVTREITVRDLLTHRAGLPNADLLWTDSRWTPSEVTRRIRTLKPVYSLRSGFIYQNVMYAVAGDVIAAASGMSWADFVRTRIFQPLGMTATEATLAGVEGKPNVAAPHAHSGDSLVVVQNRPVDPVAAAGSVWSSVTDMAKWMRFVLDSGRVNGKPVLKVTTLAEILTPQVIAPQSMYPTMTIIRPHFFTYGLAWFLHDYAGQAVAMHTGSINGMSALIGLIPDRRMGVYVLVNSDHAELRHALMYRAFDTFAGTGGASPRDWSAEFSKLYGGIEERQVAAQRAAEARRAANTTPSLPVERYVGTYVDSTYGDMVVSMKDGALHAAYGPRAGRLEHWEYETFRARTEGRGAWAVTFQPTGTGGVASLRAFGVTFTRVARP